MLDLCVLNQKVCEFGIEAMFSKSDAGQLFLEVRFRSVIRGERSPTYKNRWRTHPPRCAKVPRKMIPAPFHTPFRETIAKSRNHFPDDGTSLWGQGLRRFCHPRAEGSLNKRGRRRIRQVPSECRFRWHTRS